MSRLDAQAFDVRDVRGFLAVLEQMRADIRDKNYSDAVNLDVESFLESMSQWLQDWMSAGNAPPEEFDWRFATMLMMGGWDYE